MVQSASMIYQSLRLKAQSFRFLIIRKALNEADWFIECFLAYPPAPLLQAAIFEK